MKYFLSALYGIIQGLTEFLPVSSSGHLSAFQNIFGKIDESMSGVTYTLLLHVGTLAAVLLVYYKDVWNLIKSFFSLVSKLCTGKFKYKTFSDDEKFFCMLFVALIPLLLGAVLEGTVEFLSGYTLAIGILWILNGFILLASEKIKKETINFSQITLKNALYVGLFQLFAILPGVSRSGMTITGGLFNGFKREFAVKFSFILSIPAILGSTLITIIKDFDELFSAGNAGVILIGTFTSFVSGLCAIKLLNFITKRHSFKVFVYYCFAIGVIAIILSLCGVIA